MGGQRGQTVPGAADDRDALPLTREPRRDARHARVARPMLNETCG